jgi:MFS family permease
VQYRRSTVPAMANDQALFRMPNVRTYAAARLVSLSGAAICWVAMPLSMYGLTGSAWWTALVAVATSTPYLVFGLLAGAVADRESPQKIMVTADLVSGLALLTVPFMHILHQLHPLHVLAAAAVVQTGYVFFDAANFRVLPELVGRQNLLRANSFLSLRRWR